MLAVLDGNAGNHAAARTGYEKALRLAEELGDKAAIQRETHGLVYVDTVEGNYAAARAGYQKALRLAEELGDKAAIQREKDGLAYLDMIERRRR